MRLIDADVVIEKYGDWYVEEGSEEGFIGMLKSLIDEQPTVDSAPVVRCRSCRHYNTACCSEGCGWCECRNFGTWDEWYCADGEAGTYEID